MFCFVVIDCQNQQKNFSQRVLKVDISKCIFSFFSFQKSCAIGKNVARLKTFSKKKKKLDQNQNNYNTQTF
ncbi:unnamed protein product [Meloidogyne enterolobii]|uniref:Uncharacterized protein n=1 Tax=Meloidogyne enterolobii TaxID=390850 RepID=A0ACB1AUB4_MELEN